MNDATLRGDKILTRRLIALLLLQPSAPKKGDFVDNRIGAGVPASASPIKSPGKRQDFAETRIGAGVEQMALKPVKVRRDHCLTAVDLAFPAFSHTTPASVCYPFVKFVHHSSTPTST